MAIKPKKEMTDAQKAKLKKMLSQGGNLDKAAKERAAAKKKASYSPAPMSAFAKEKAAMRGAKTAEKIKNPMGLKTLPKEGPSTASKVVKAAKKAAGYTPAGMAFKGAKAVVKAARGGMSVKEENKQLAKTVRNIGKADKKKK